MDVIGFLGLGLVFGFIVYCVEVRDLEVLYILEWGCECFEKISELVEVLRKNKEVIG